MVRALAKAGLAAEAIHGNKSQNQRERVLAAFRAGKVRTLVATDIAARGIDVDGISHVVNYDLPNIPESYVHRIGRTARAGAEGIAISFCDGEERAYLRDIEKLIRMSIPATERRGERQPQPSRSRTDAANGSHASERQAAAAPAERPASTQGRPQQGRPQQKRPQQGRHRNAPRNGNPRREREPPRRRRIAAGRRSGKDRPHAGPARRPTTGDIVDVAFMKQQRSAAGTGRGAPAHHRAPR